MTPTSTSLQLDPLFLSFVGGVVIPMIVALVTKARAASWVKVVVNALLAAAAGGVATAVAADGKVVWEVWAMNMGVAWVTSLAAYLGVHAKLGTTQAIAEATAGVGVGPEVAPAEFDPSVLDVSVEPLPPHAPSESLTREQVSDMIRRAIRRHKSDTHV